MNLFTEKRRSNKGRILLLVLLALVALWLIGKRYEPDAAPVATEAPSPAGTLEFLADDVTLIQPQEFRQVLPLSGELRAVSQSSVKALVSGTVRDVMVREGEAITAGTVLIRMDEREYQSKVEQARGALLAARGQMNISQQTRDNNQALLDKGFISRNAFDTGNIQYQIAKANAEAAQAALDVAEKALRDTTIVAPISGIVSSRTVEPGEKVSTDNKLLDIIDLDQMEMDAPVPASDILHVALGQEVLVTVSGLPHSLPGKVSRINPATQSGSRSIMVYIRVENPDNLLRGGMYAEASLTLAKKDNTISIPPSAIHTQGDQNFVYGIVNNHLKLFPVKLGILGANLQGRAIEITDGLPSGTMIVRNNLGKLQEGAVVHVAQATGAANKPADPATTKPADKPAPTGKPDTGTATKKDKPDTSAKQDDDADDDTASDE